MFDTNVSPEMVELCRLAGSDDDAIALPAQRSLAKFTTAALREGIYSGENLDGIFKTMDFTDGRPIEMALDFYGPGAERDHVAYLIPSQGRIPERNVEGDFVVLPTYRVGSSIDTRLAYIENARWDVVSRMNEVLEAGFVKKMNDDGWHIILGAAVDRNVLVYDADAAAGQMTARLVSLMKLVIRRNGGGNATSLNRFKLTDLYTSPEAQEDIRNWKVDQVPDQVRTTLFNSTADDAIKGLFGVNFHTLDELGVGQEYQAFYTNDLLGTMGASDEEIVVGIDKSKPTTFVMPVRKAVSVFNDPWLHRQQRFGYYGWTELGFGILDNRVAVIGSM
jgi:hypothetical protein